MGGFLEKGSHVLCDAWGVTFDKLNDAERLIEVMERGATKSGAEVLHTYAHKFDPNGVTVQITLSESHFTIHTYPERGFAGIDCYTCGEHCNPEVAVEFLLNYLVPIQVQRKTVGRGDRERGLE